MCVRFQPSAGHGGFTIIEVIVVIVILAVVSLGAMAVGMDSRGVETIAEVDVLRAHLGFMQSMAMANNTVDWSVAFSGASYVLLADGAPSPVNLPGESSPTHVFPAGVTLSAGAGILSIDSWGAPAADYLVRLSGGSRQESVTIRGFTGLVQ